jgi:hypothetical protein
MKGGGKNNDNKSNNWKRALEAFSMSYDFQMGALRESKKNGNLSSPIANRMSQSAAAVPAVFPTPTTNCDPVVTLAPTAAVPVVSTNAAALEHNKHYKPKPSSMSKDSAHTEAVAISSSPFLKDAIQNSAPSSSSSSASSSYSKKRGADNAPENGAQVRRSKISKEGIMVEGQLAKMNANMEGFIQACNQRAALEMQRLQQPRRRELSAAQEALEDVDKRYADMIPAATLLRLKRKLRADLGEIDCYLASNDECRQLIIEEHWQEIDPVGYASAHPAFM